MAKYKVEMVIEVTEGNPRKWVADAIWECLNPEAGEDIIECTITEVEDGE